ncbi:hypothetical protein A2U01_0076229, partial [Trifolium medium]|nr:hypothetical protein [Trifolium medium]
LSQRYSSFDFDGFSCEPFDVVSYGFFLPLGDVAERAIVFGWRFRAVK